MKDDSFSLNVPWFLQAKEWHLEERRATLLQKTEMKKKLSVLSSSSSGKGWRGLIRKKKVQSHLDWIPPSHRAQVPGVSDNYPPINQPFGFMSSKKSFRGLVQMLYIFIFVLFCRKKIHKKHTLRVVPFIQCRKGGLKYVSQMPHLCGQNTKGGQSFIVYIFI